MGRNPLKGVWVALAVVVGLIVGIAGGALSFFDGRTLAGSLIFGGASFGGTVLLVLMIINMFFQDPRR